ncbi:calcium-dependent phosphotriesterase [Serendipita vermifera]|nr:calcium-dependent phosphotriesterase [Serendipita vermifera]
MPLKTVGMGSFGAVVVTFAVAWFYLSPTLRFAGLYPYRPIENFNTENCSVERGLQACEKMVLHSPSGFLYLACSTPTSRIQWTPALDRLERPRLPTDPEQDYIAVLDTSLPLSSHPYRKLRLTNLPTTDPKWRGVNVHGIDVVESDTEPNMLWVYLINHRPPMPPFIASEHGADSCVEIFKTTVGGDSLEYVRTVENPEFFITPNDIVGQADGTGFWTSNDHTTKVGLKRKLLSLFVHEGLGITYCHVEKGCNYAITGLPNINGMARAPKNLQKEGKDYFYAVGYGGSGKVFVLERQSDNSLVQVDEVQTEYVLDNPSVDSQGTIYVAGFPRPLNMISGPYMDDPVNNINPSIALRATVNPAAFFGDKYKVERIFETDGSVVSGSTSAVWDEKHNLLWITGVASTGLAACKL